MSLATMRGIRRTAWLCLGAAALAGCAGEQFERVEERPEGIQIEDIASGVVSRSHASEVTDRYDASYAVVWDSTVRVARRVEALGVEPVLRLDPAHGHISLRESHVMSQEETDYDPDQLRLRGWIDEFQFQVTALSNDRTKVTVSRTVRGIPGFRLCAYVLSSCGNLFEPEVSNGKIEDWILTQIEDGLAQQGQE